MKKFLISTLLLITTISNIIAQVTVTGKVIEGNTKEPLSFVIITVTDNSSNKPVASGLTDDSGAFTISLNPGSYNIKASSIGYTTVEKNITAEGENVRAGRFILTEDAQTIKEIEVVGQKSGMTLDIDKKVFNVSENIMSEGTSASEILNSIPSVNVDIDGNVSLRNSSSVEIWLNGKATGLSDADKGQLLEMIPAESIEKVELITNPSAKYNPEGSSGIINIVTKTSKQGGYYGNVTTGISYNEGSPWPSGNVGLNFNYASEKWDFTLSANGRYRRQDRTHYSNRTSWVNSDTTYLNQDDKSSSDRVNGFLKAGFTYHIDQKNDIGLSGMGMVGPNWNKKGINYTNMNKDKDTTLLSDRNTYSNGIFGFYNISADYKHVFEKDKHELTANIGYFGHIRDSKNNYTTNSFDYPGHNLKSNTYQLQTQGNNSHRVSGQIDYMNRIKSSRFEAGIKIDYTKTNSLDHTFDSIFAENSLVEDLSRYNPFDYNEQIYAAYFNYANQINWFSFMVGIRCEETVTNTQSLEDGTEKKYNRSYFQPFPSAYLSFTLPKNNEIQVNYTRRINRPRGRTLNSYIDRTDPTNISQGNPLVMPEFGNNVELNYLKSWEYHTITVGLFYRYTENVIQKVSKMLDEHIMYSTYENITYRQNAGIEIVAKNRLFKNYLDLTSSISGYYDLLGENAEYHIAKKQSFSWQARINANIKIINNLSAQVSGNYNSPRIMAQGRQDHSYSIDLGLKASFLNKTLTLSAAVRDLLNSRFNHLSISESDNFYQESMNTSSGRQYRLTLTYNFGNYKQKGSKKNRDKNNRDDSNMNDSMDDMSEGF